MADEDVLEWPVRTADYMEFDIRTNVNPLPDPVKVALPAHRSPPTDADYDVLEAEWSPGQEWTAESPVVTCRVFVPKNHLTRGDRYDPWVQVTDNPAVPEMRAGADERGRGGTVVKGV